MLQSESVSPAQGPMDIWQVDCYRRPLQSAEGVPLWELLICSSDRCFTYTAFCPQPALTVDWLVAQLQQAHAGKLPQVLQVFRPQCLGLLTTASETLGVAIAATRHTPALKQWLRERSQDYAQMPGFTGQIYDPLAIDQPPPLPLPEEIWGDRWQFAAIAAENLSQIAEKPIPIREMPPERWPLQQGLASNLPIPGVVIIGGRQSLRLARWLQAIQPVYYQAIAGEPNGLVLEAGLADRWVLATFSDAEVVTAARIFQTRKTSSRGLHFLLIQPDDTGITYSGFWLLQDPVS